MSLGFIAHRVRRQGSFGEHHSAIRIPRNTLTLSRCMKQETTGSTRRLRSCHRALHTSKAHSPVV